jgi:hypothetical protein
MFKESKSAISIAKDSERWKTLTSQKAPAPPEGLLDQKSVFQGQLHAQSRFAEG